MIDLKSVVEKYPECLDSATKFKSYMMDLYPDNSNKARIRILADIVDCGIALEIKNGKTDNISISNFCNTMENQYGYSAKLVEECLDQFIIAFGFKTEATKVPPRTTENILNNDCAIAMIGIGGAGGNAINKANKQNGISLISIDDGIEWTDTSKADEKISINLKPGYNDTYTIADSDVAKIDAVTSRFSIIFIFAGLGGKTGTNISPTVIRSAQKNGAMVITVMTKPFLFEGKDRANIAENGEKNIKEISDCYIVVANELLKFVSSAKLTFSNAFLFVDELIAEIVQVILNCIPPSISSQKTISDESKKKIIEEINRLVPDYKIVESVGPVIENKLNLQNINKTEDSLQQTSTNSRQDLSSQIERNYIRKRQAHISAGPHHSVGIRNDGTVISVGANFFGDCDVENWKDIIAVSASDARTIGLKSNGKVIATKFTGKSTLNPGKWDVSDWANIVEVSAGPSHTVGLRADGTVVATRYLGDSQLYHGQCDVSRWRDIVAIAAGYSYTVGLKSDGTVVTTKYINSKVGDFFNLHELSKWKNIVAVTAGGFHTVGLKSDGTVLAVGAVGSSDHGQYNVNGWTDIVAVSAGAFHTVGLRSNGTVVATGSNNVGECDVNDWSDIVAISAGSSQTLGLKSDGTVVATGSGLIKECKNMISDINTWSCIKLPKILNTQKEFDEKKQKQLNAIRDQRNRYQSQGVCQYCGSQFDGFIFKKCSNCGKPKDY